MERVKAVRGEDYREMDKVMWGSDAWKGFFMDRLATADAAWAGKGDIGKMLQWPAYFVAAKCLVGFEYFEARGPLKHTAWKRYRERHPTVSES